MSQREILNLLTANVDKVVRLTFKDGEGQTVKIHVVDDDGVVYFLVSSNEVGKQAYWTVIGDIESVLPLKGTE